MEKKFNDVKKMYVWVMVDKPNGKIFPMDSIFSTISFSSMKEVVTVGTIGRSCILDFSGQYYVEIMKKKRKGKERKEKEKDRKKEKEKEKKKKKKRKEKKRKEKKKRKYFSDSLCFSKNHYSIKAKFKLLIFSWVPFELLDAKL